MVQLPAKRNWGKATENENPLLVRHLDTMYGDITNAMSSNVNKREVASQDAPADNQVNKNFNIGDIWVRMDTDTAWVMTSRKTSEQVVWKQIT